ncbi:MAG TPA: putative PEP-binding protein [Candidatus Limnocylindria bacterium]|jgi:phosphoenolpyruvate-protein phosphotransferase|nr:putative PEP-binding protein [Candidatus Limnocylindria bacterium]
MSERALRGVSAAPGIATGRAVVIGQRSAASVGLPVSESDRAAELIKARGALASAAAELQSIADSLRSDGRAAEADIVETGVLMAQDPSLEASLERLVLASGITAQVALQDAAEESAAELALLDDPMLAERADDVRSLGRRAAAHAGGVRLDRTGGVLVADSLGPADVAELSGVRGVALARGGVTAHAAIVARSLGLPMVVGVGPELLEVEDGEEVVLDGDASVVVRFPSPARLAQARESIAVRQRARDRAVTHRDEPAITGDGHRVSILGNAASVAEVLEALAQGAEGIGLLRTELLFLDAPSWPPQEQQVRFLTPILAELSGRIATVRLLDFGGDKTPPFLRGTKERGVELMLHAPEALKAQLSAVLEAGSKTRLRILVPLITSPAQVLEVHAALTAVLDGRPRPALGAMIETPDAARRAAEIAKEVDFLSIGTNDLTQMVLGLDREQSKSAPVTDVRVLRLIDMTIRAASDAGIPVDVCGEAASDAVAMPILVGLGAGELSVAAARVGEVRERVRALRFDESEKLAVEALLGQVADAGRERV